MGEVNKMPAPKAAKEGLLVYCNNSHPNAQKPTKSSNNPTQRKGNSGVPICLVIDPESQYNIGNSPTAWASPVRKRLNWVGSENAGTFA